MQTSNKKIIAYFQTFDLKLSRFQQYLMNHKESFPL